MVLELRLSSRRRLDFAIIGINCSIGAITCQWLLLVGLSNGFSCLFISKLSISIIGSPAVASLLFRIAIGSVSRMP
jgi:hypothetical protein